MLSLHSKNTIDETLTRIFLLVSWYREFHDSWEYKSFKKKLPYYLSRLFQRNEVLIERKNSEGIDILESRDKMNHRWGRISRLARAAIYPLSILSSTCTRLKRRVRVAQFSWEDCSYHPFETTTTTRLRPLD